jgi:lipopolysaccharide transport system permease protein
LSSPPTTQPIPGSGRLARLAFALIRILAPAIGEPRAQWLVSRVYAILYLVRFYIASQLARTSLGFLWVGLAPLLLVAVYLPIFLVVFKVRLPGHDSPLDYTLFALVGLIAWNSVADAIAQSTGSLVYNATVVRHAPTPPIMLPIIKVLTAFVWLVVGFAVLIVILAAMGRNPGVRLALLPGALGLLLAFLVGLGLFLSAAAAYVHDLVQVLPTLLAVEFFAAPITYAPEMVTGRLVPIVQWNPLTPFLALFRCSFLPWEPFAWSDLALAGAWATGVFVLGIVTFRALEGGLRDVV